MNLVHYSLTLKGSKYQNLEKLPAEYSIHGSGYTAWVLIVFSVFLGAEAIVNLVHALVVSRDVSELRGQDWIFAPIGVCFLCWGLNQFFISGSLTVDSQQVRCSYKSLFGGDHWIEPLSQYRGLKKKTEKKHSGAFKQIIYAIWLVHDQRKKSLKLNTSGSHEYWDSDMARYSGLLGLREID